MATMEQIAREVQYPRIAAVAGTDEEQTLQLVWLWASYSFMYARIAVNKRQFSHELVQKDIKIVWDRAIAWAEKHKDGYGANSDIIPHVVDYCIELMQEGTPPEIPYPVELTDEERLTLEKWARRCVLNTLWYKMDDPSPGADMMARLRTWIDGKIARDFTSEALQDMRFLIAVTLQTMKSIFNGTLNFKLEENETTR